MDAIDHRYNNITREEFLDLNSHLLSLPELLVEWEFDVPVNRLNDIQWLRRNILVKNNNHPKLGEILKLLK